MTLPTRKTRSAATPSRRRFSTPLGSVTNSQWLIASVRMRLISSGIVRSKLRRPASTWATGTPSLTAVRAQAIVELTSPTTTTASGRCSSTTGSNRFITSAVWHGVAARSHPQVDVGPGNLQLLEEQLRHPLVVVLAGVDEVGLDAGTALDLPHQRGDLHEVGPGAGDDKNPVHGSEPTPEGPRQPCLKERRTISMTRFASPSASAGRAERRSEPVLHSTWPHTLKSRRARDSGSAAGSRPVAPAEGSPPCRRPRRSPRRGAAGPTGSRRKTAGCD